MPALWELTADLAALDSLLEERGGDVSDPDVEKTVGEWFTGLAEAEAEKLAGYCRYVRKLETEAAVADAEAEQYAAKAKARRNRVAWLKDRMKSHLQATGRKEVQTADGRTIAVQGNGGKLPVWQALALNPSDMTAAEVTRCPERFLKPKVALDLDALRSALEAGEAVESARIEPRGTHLRIR